MSTTHTHIATFSNGQTITRKSKKILPFAWIMSHVQSDHGHIQTFCGFASTREAATRESKSKHGITARREVLFSEVVESKVL